MRHVGRASQIIVIDIGAPLGFFELDRFFCGSGPGRSELRQIRLQFEIALSFSQAGTLGSML